MLEHVGPLDHATHKRPVLVRDVDLEVYARGKLHMVMITLKN